MTPLPIHVLNNERPATRPLTAREQAFVIAFLDCWNATEAAKRSGAMRGPTNAGFRMLRTPAVRDAIRDALEGMVMSANETLTRMSMMAMTSLEDFVDDQGNIDIKQAKKRGLLFLVKKYKTRAVTSTTTGATTVTTEIELHDSQAALMQIGRYHGLWVDRTEHTGPNGGPIEIDDIRQRLIARFNQADAARQALDAPHNAE